MLHVHFISTCHAEALILVLLSWRSVLSAEHSLLKCMFIDLSSFTKRSHGTIQVDMRSDIYCAQSHSLIYNILILHATQHITCMLGNMYTLHRQMCLLHHTAAARACRTNLL